MIPCFMYVKIMSLAVYCDPGLIVWIKFQRITHTDDIPLSGFSGLALFKEQQVWPPGAAVSWALPCHFIRIQNLVEADFWFDPIVGNHGNAKTFQLCMTRFQSFGMAVDEFRSG